MKLSAALDLYFAEKWDLAQTTVTTYNYHLRHFSSFVGDPEIEDITSDDIRKYLAHIITEIGLSRRTASDHWICLSSIFTWAEETLMVEHPIKNKVKRPRFQTKRIDVLTEDECRALLRCVGFTKYVRKDGKEITVRRKTASRDKAILLVLLDVGLRASELCNLTIGDWVPGRGRLQVRQGKGRYGGKDRSVFLGNGSKAALVRYLAERGKAKDSDPLFASSSNLPMNRNNLRHMICTVASTAGVRQGSMGPHLCRHTMAVNFLRNGGNIRTLQELLGHESLETVTVYLNLAERDIEAATEFSPADRMGLR